MALKLGTLALRGDLKLTSEYELHILSNTEASSTKEHGENYRKVKPSFVAHLVRHRPFYN